MVGKVTVDLRAEDSEDPERPVFLSPSQVARALGVHRATVYRWLKDGSISGVRDRRQWQVPVEEMERFAKKTGRKISFNLRLRLQWPLTRTTVGQEHPHLGWEALEDAFAWVCAFKLQFRRLMASFSREFLEFLQQFGGRPETAVEVTVDQHFLVIAGHHMFRALERASKHFGTLAVDDKEGRLKTLRDLYEHWDEQRSTFRCADGERKRSAAAFERLVPGGQPWSADYYPDDVVLAGVSVRGLLDDLKGVELVIETLRKDLRAEAKHLPQGGAADDATAADGPVLRLTATKGSPSTERDPSPGEH